MSLVSVEAFQYNIALQPRAFLVMGCLARGEIDDELISRILQTLSKSLLAFDESESRLTVSTIMCLTSMIDSSVTESKFLGHLFWIAVALLQISHSSIFTPALSLVQTVLRSMYMRGYFVHDCPSSILMHYRSTLDDICSLMDSTVGVSFKTDFSFAFSTVVFKGLRNPATKSPTMNTLILMLELSAPSIYYSLISELSKTGSDEAQALISSGQPLGYVDSRVLGFLVPLLPMVEGVEWRDLLWTAGVNSNELEESFIAGAEKGDEKLNKHRYFKILDHMGIPDSIVASLLISILVTTLEVTDNENELFFLYSLLAEISFVYPIQLSLS